MKRRRFKQTTSLEQRLTAEAERLRKERARCPARYRTRAAYPARPARRDSRAPSGLAWISRLASAQIAYEVAYAALNKAPTSPSY